MAWRFPPDTSIDGLRARTAVLGRRLGQTRPRWPGWRLAVMAGRLGSALAAWALLERRTPRSRAGLSHRLRAAFGALGPTYIKLGQILSAGDGIFPPELVAEFRQLRDRVDPEDAALVRATVEAELGRPLEAVFASFDPRPRASASIAQVHAATLRTGEEVVVKVQRHDVAELVRRDIRVMAWIAPLLVGRIPVSALANPPALVELFASTIVEELDFRLEAQNMLDIAAVLATTGQRAIVVPRPHRRLVTRRVLVMERLDGFVWDDARGMRASGIDTAAVLRSCLIAFLEGALLFGVFHGDLHGGNLLVLPDGVVALLDFGITGRLGEGQRQALLRLQIAATTNDVAAQIGALRALGALPADTDVDEVIRELGLDAEAVDPTTMTADQMLDELRRVTTALLGIGAQMPKALMLFVKNLIFLNGAMAQMAPDIDLLGEVVAVATYFAQKHGDRIARDIGLDVAATPIDVDGYRAAFGLDPGQETFTFRQLQERRAVIRERLQNRRAHRERRPRLGRLLARGLGRRRSAERPEPSDVSPVASGRR
jgi:ubiquinone biosynthesis protein